MKRIQKTLMAFFWYIICLNVIMMSASAILLSMMGPFVPDELLQYIFSMIAVVSVFVLIPLSLRLMKFRKVEELIARNPLEEYRNMAVIRMTLLYCGLCFSNIGFFFFYTPTFLYINIIFMIAFVFVYPSLDRCYHEANYLDA
jgi:hypothetical protein